MSCACHVIIKFTVFYVMCRLSFDCFKTLKTPVKGIVNAENQAGKSGRMCTNSEDS